MFQNSTGFFVVFLIEVFALESIISVTLKKEVGYYEEIYGSIREIVLTDPEYGADMLYDFPVIPLSIQPIVEDAIRHGIYESGCLDGLVTVRTAETEDSITITVIDNGNGFDPEIIKSQTETGKRDHAGLQNLIFRLENMMNASVDIQSKIGEGTRVEVVIPKGGGEPLRKR